MSRVSGLGKRSHAKFEMYPELSGISLHRCGQCGCSNAARSEDLLPVTCSTCGASLAKWVISTTDFKAKVRRMSRRPRRDRQGGRSGFDVKHSTPDHFLEARAELAEMPEPQKPSRAQQVAARLLELRKD